MTEPITLDEDPDPEWYGVTEDAVYFPGDSCAYVIPPPEPRPARPPRPAQSADDDIPPF
jgi:hypothetical protein